MRRVDGRWLAPLFALGAAVAHAAAPQRIVSLDLCSDWLLMHHAPRASVVGLSPLRAQWRVDQFAGDWPAHDGTLERILRLRPDLVIVGQYNATVLRERLKALGVRVEVLPLPTNLPEVVEYEQRFLALLGLSAARVSVPETRAPAGSARLLLLGANGIGTGRGTLEDDILRQAGWNNYLQADGYLPLDLERLVTDPPDAVLWATPSSPALANRFAMHPALRRAAPLEHWLTTDTWRWQCPGPWTWELVRELRAMRRP